MNATTDFLLSASELSRAAHADGSDTYFAGLLSQRLGETRPFDEEFAEVIADDPEFDALINIYSSDPNLRQLVLATFLQICPSVPPVNGNGVSQSGITDEWKARAVWIVVMKDPRFDLIWKRALADTRPPTETAHGSWMAAAAALVKSFTQSGPALASAALPLVGGAVLGGSLVAGGNVLATKPSEAAAETVRQATDANGKSADNVASAGKQLIAAVERLQQSLLEQNRAMSALSSKFDSLDTKLPAAPSSVPGETSAFTNDQYAGIRQAVNNGFQSWNNTLADTNRSLDQIRKDLPSGKPDLKAIERSLSEIDRGVGVSGEDRPSQLKQEMDAANAKLDFMSKGIETLKKVADTANQSLDKIGLQLIDVAPGLDPLSELKENDLSMRLGTRSKPYQIDGCDIVLIPVLIDSQSAKLDYRLEYRKAPCRIPAEGASGSLTIDHSRRIIPGTSVEVALDSVDNHRIWPFPRTVSFLHRGIAVRLYKRPSQPATITGSTGQP